MDDTFGQNIEDVVLGHLVAKWHNWLRRRDVFVRTGGDGFVVLLGDADPAHYESVAKDLLAPSDESILTVTGVASSLSAGMALLRRDEDPARLSGGRTRPSISPNAPGRGALSQTAPIWAA